MCPLIPSCIHWSCCAPASPFPTQLAIWDTHAFLKCHYSPPTEARAWLPTWPPQGEFHCPLPAEGAGYNQTLPNIKWIYKIMGIIIHPTWWGRSCGLRDTDQYNHIKSYNSVMQWIKLRKGVKRKRHKELLLSVFTSIIPYFLTIVALLFYFILLFFYTPRYLPLSPTQDEGCSILDSEWLILTGTCKPSLSKCTR